MVMSSRNPAKGAIPLDEALPIAKQIAEALEVAHEQGIIRRDLGTSEDAKLMMEQLASWDVSNSRDLAYSFGRASIMLTKFPRACRDSATPSPCSSSAAATPCGARGACHERARTGEDKRVPTLLVQCRRDDDAIVQWQF